MQRSPRTIAEPCPGEKPHWRVLVDEEIRHGNVGSDVSQEARCGVEACLGDQALEEGYGVLFTAGVARVH